MINQNSINFLTIIDKNKKKKLFWRLLIKASWEQDTIPMIKAIMLYMVRLWVLIWTKKRTWKKDSSHPRSRSSQLTKMLFIMILLSWVKYQKWAITQPRLLTKILIIKLSKVKGISTTHKIIQFCLGTYSGPNKTRMKGSMTTAVMTKMTEMEKQILRPPFVQLI